MTETLRLWLSALFALSACAELSAPAQGEPLRARFDAGSLDASATVQLALDAALPVASEALGTPTHSPTAEPLDAGDASFREASPPDAQIPFATTRTGLVVPERWLLVDASDDPFDDRPAMINCSTAGVVPETLSEERVLGVETGWCNYLTAFQPTLRPVQAGEVIKVRLWHFELSAPEPAEAHAAVHIGGLRVLDERIAIPQPGRLIVKQFTVEQPIPGGTPVHFHLHNHGANSWALVEVSAGPAPK